VAELERRFGVTRAKVLEAEFPVFTNLGFALSVPPQ
jgi:hypothetical protein